MISYKKNSNIKILFICPGNSIHSFNWINYFANKHKKIFWLSYHGYKFTGKFNIIRNYFSNTFFLLSPFFTLFCYLKIRPDLIHIHSVSRNLYTSIFLLIFFKKKIILTPWGSDFFYPNFITKILQNLLFNNCYFISDSYLILKKLNYYSTKKNLFKINFGINCNFFKKINKKNIRPTKKIYKNKKIIFCPRGYDPVYNNQLIIEMINILKSKVKNYVFVFIGTPNIHQKVLFDLVIKYNINDQVLFLGRQSRKQILNLYNISELIISASKSDAGISSAVSESMSCEKAVLISDNRDNKLWINNNKNGFLFKNNNLKDLQSSFVKIIKQKRPFLLSIGANARKTQLFRNNINIEMQKVELVYRMICAKKTS
tara:strand:- start:67 stop:1179 length:1113 start_codon:yes stop_codon:yes gene_type:complete